MKPPIVQVLHVTKKFAVTAVSDVSFAVEAGEFFILLGPSGCGKSTLLRIMSGLEKSYSGRVTFAAGITRRDMSFVFQQFALWPWLTVAENIGIGLVARHADPKHRVERELTRFGLEKYAGAYPRELSGGMRQRVGIARALATDPKIIFMDEPFSELDSFTAEALRKDLLAIWKETQATIIMVTHLIPEAIELGSRIAVMTSRPGRLEHVIENSLPRPRATRTKPFFAMEDALYKLVAP